MAPKLYMAQTSPAVRGVLLTAKAINLELELYHIDLLAGEHLTPEYLKMNPQHTIPTLDDNGFIVWDSHAINAYLVTKYARDDSLYPKDPQRRAVIDQRLHFDSGILFPRLLAIVGPIFQQGAKSIPKDKADAVTIAYSILEELLERSKYVAEDNLSIADLSIAATVTSLSIVVPIAENRFPKISAWLEMIKSLPYYVEGNQIGLDIFSNYIKSKLG